MSADGVEVAQQHGREARRCGAVVAQDLLDHDLRPAVGVGAVSGAADTYWSKNKGRSAEGKLVKITSVLGALFIILSIVLCMNMK